MTVVEWDKTVRNPRSILVLTDAVGNGLHDQLDGVTRASWSYTAFFAWDGFLADRAHLGYELGQSDETDVLIRAALKTLSEYVRAKRDARRARLVAAWKADGSYPYAADSRGALEEAERDLFDVIAITAAPVLEDMTPGVRKLSLHMMREALTKDPTQLGTVLTEVLTSMETSSANFTTSYSAPPFPPSSPPAGA